jgi:RNA polymerase sigma-70 factor (ECF subfamily)
MKERLESIYRQDSRRVFSTLVRLLGSFDLAEEALHDAFVAAAEQWPVQGVPANPVAWLVSAGRFKAIDRMRRDRRFTPWDEAAELADTVADPAPGWEQRWTTSAGDRRRPPAPGLHLLPPQPVGRRAHRADAARGLRPHHRGHRQPPAWWPRPRWRSASCAPRPRSPRPASLMKCQTRWSAGAAGQRAARGLPGLQRRPCARRPPRLADEAIRLARLLRELLPEPEVQGLLALLLLHDARRAARLSARPATWCRWKRRTVACGTARIAEGCALAEAARCRSAVLAPMRCRRPSPRCMPKAPSAAATDWPQIVGLYDALLRLEPSPVIALNRAVAVAMRDGPEAGLALIEALLPALPGYHPAPAAAADLYRRAGRLAEAQTCYRAAAALAQQEPERRFLLKRLAEVGG